MYAIYDKLTGIITCTVTNYEHNYNSVNQAYIEVDGIIDDTQYYVLNNKIVERPDLDIPNNIDMCISVPYTIKDTKGAYYKLLGPQLHIDGVVDDDDLILQFDVTGNYVLFLEKIPYKPKEININVTTC